MATYTFVESFSMWHHIKTGSAEIPWGTMLGGQGDAGGDMDNLSSMGWSDAQIVNTYSQLGNVCLFVSIGFYIFFLLKSLPNRSWRQLNKWVNLIILDIYSIAAAGYPKFEQFFD